MHRSRRLWAAAAVCCPAAALAAPCPGDHDGDGNASVGDLIAMLSDFSAGARGADYVDDGVIAVSDLIEYLRLFGLGCDADADSDGDGLRDVVETGTGVYVGRGNTGTDPHRRDTDQDGLDDGVEVLGTPEGLDLRAFGVSPLRRDILVEVDWFAGQFEGQYRNFRPTTHVVNAIRAVFAGAPLLNPDGSTGVSIWIDCGQGGPNVGGNQLPGEPVYITFDGDFNAYKAAHFDPRRKGYFHYAIFANRYNSPTNGSSGIAEVRGDDFMVTISNYWSWYNAAATFVHEIGHNLGLRHGGFEDRNRKPNYNSVMNYRHQFPGVDVNLDGHGDGVIDYSRGVNIPLDETALHEPDGLAGPGSPPIDWNRNGVIDPFPVAANINCENSVVTPCGGTSSACYDSTCTVLFDQNDWEAINWSRLALSSDGAPPLLVTRAEIIECDNAPPSLLPGE